MSEPRPVVYDMTRLVTRVTTDSPNGIDRVDLTLAKHFAFRPRGAACALIWTIAGPRLVPLPVARAIVSEIEGWWGEADRQDTNRPDRLYEAIVARLANPESGTGRLVRPVYRRWGTAVAAIWNYGLRLGRSPAHAAPRSAAYINASHYPLEYRPHLAWLRARPDVAPFFFIHDLLPIEAPQYFWPTEPAKHRRRLQHIQQVHGRALVASAAVARKVVRHFAQSGYAMPMARVPLPAAPIFHTPRGADSRLTQAKPYFLVCGTIEPRKNHIFLLHLWRQLVEDLGDAAPTLVIAGKRGWNSEDVVAFLERSRVVPRHVIEVAGLSSPALKQLMDGARALLAPSLCEGFGLPVAEAIAAGCPVVAADIDVFREMPAGGMVLIDRLDGPAWLKAIREMMPGPRPAADVSAGAAIGSVASFAEQIERIVNASEGAADRPPHR